MLKKESEILYCFAKEPWKRYTFSELQKVSGKKSKSYLALVLKRFVSNQLLRQETISRLPVYSLNMDTVKARAFAGFVLEHHGWNKRNIPYADLQKAMDKLPNKGYIFIITGSYAKSQQRKESDIDTVILIDDSSEPKRAYAELSHFCEMNIPQIHLYVFRNKEFIEMLCSKEANYGKEAARNNLVLAGGQVYLKLIHEAMSCGFKG